MINKYRSQVLSRCLALSLIPGLFVACAERRNLQEMHDTTVEMNETTKVMSERMKATEELNNKMSLQLKATSEVFGATQEMLKRIDATYVDLRQGNSRELRRKELEAMRQSPTLEDKFTHAAVYFMSFEYQLLKNETIDDEARREAIYASAAEEFLMTLNEYMPADRSLPLVDSAENDVQTGYTLAAAAHIVNPNTEAELRKQSKEPISILTLIKSALEMKKSLDESTNPKELATVPPYVAKVLANESNAIFFLKMRLMVLSSIVVQKTSKLDHAGRPGLVKFFDKIGMLNPFFTKGWNLEMDHMNTYNMQLLTQLTNEAVSTYDFLAGLDVKPNLGFSMTQIYRQMIVPHTMITPGMTNKATARADLLKSIDELRTRMIK